MQKNLSIKHQKIIGSPVFPPGIFALSGVFEKGDTDLLSRRGKLFVLVSLSGPKNFDAVVASKIILDCLEDDYFREKEGSPLSALEKAAISANHRFIDLSLGSSLSGSTELNLVAAVSWGQVLYLSKIGSSVVYLLRGGSVREISLGEETQVATASGLVSEEDVLILGTRKFREMFPPERLLHSLPSLEEEISKEPERAVAALILKFEITEKIGKDEAIRFAEKKKTSRRLRLPRLSRPKWRLPHFVFLLSRLGLRPTKELFLRKRGLRRSGVVSLRFFLLVVVLLFLGSVAYTLKKQNQTRLRKEAQELTSRAEFNVGAAKDLVDLNNLRAGELLSEALSNLGQVRSLGLADEAAEALSGKAQELLSLVRKEKRVEAKIIYDFSFQKREGDLSSLVFSSDDGAIFVSDRLLGAVYKLTLKEGDRVSIEKIDGGKVKEPRFLSASSFGLLGLDHEGLFLINHGEGEIKTGILSTSGIGELRDFKFYGANLYFLSSQGGILRALGSDNGQFGKPSRWLKEGNLDFSAAVSFSIDGSVYVLNREGKVLKFEGGEPIDFNLGGFSSPLGSPLAFDTDSLSNFLYLLDGGNKRLLLFSKEGSYQRQVTFQNEAFNFGSPVRFAVNEKGKRAYFLSGLKLYVVSLD